MCCWHGQLVLPPFLGTALLPGPMDCTPLPVSWENDSQLCQTFNSQNKQNCTQTPPAHRVSAASNLCCHLAPQPKGEFQGLQVANGARHAAGWNCGITELAGRSPAGIFYFHLSLFCSQDVPKAAFMDWAKPEAGGACCSHVALALPDLESDPFFSAPRFLPVGALLHN